MTQSTYPMVGVPVMRAVRYPHVIGPDADPDGDIEPVEVTQLTVDTDVQVVGRVTLTAMADPSDAWGLEFDLDPADARELAKRLVEAASSVDPDGQTRPEAESTPVTPAAATPTPVIESVPSTSSDPIPRTRPGVTACTRVSGRVQGHERSSMHDPAPSDDGTTMSRGASCGRRPALTREDGVLTMTGLRTILDELEQAGLIESLVRADGQVARRLTAEGIRVSPSLAMADPDVAEVVLEGLCDAARVKRTVRLERCRPMTGTEALSEMSMAVEHILVDRLRPDPANPRRMTEAEREALTTSLARFGFVEPVLARREDATESRVDLAPPAMRRMSRTKKEENVSEITDIATEPQGATEDERIEQLVSSGVSVEDEGEVGVWVCACEEPWAVGTGMRLTEDDAWALADVLRQAASLVAGSEPQTFIRLRLVDDDTA